MTQRLLARWPEIDPVLPSIGIRAMAPHVARTRGSDAEFMKLYINELMELFVRCDYDAMVASRLAEGLCILDAAGVRERAQRRLDDLLAKGEPADPESANALRTLLVLAGDKPTLDALASSVARVEYQSLNRIWSAWVLAKNGRVEGLDLLIDRAVGMTGASYEAAQTLVLLNSVIEDLPLAPGHKWWGPNRPTNKPPLEGESGDFARLSIMAKEFLRVFRDANAADTMRDATDWLQKNRKSLAFDPAAGRFRLSAAP